MHFSFTATVSSAPAFSPVLDRGGRNSRFNGFGHTIPEAAEAAGAAGDRRITGLKPGANERETDSDNFANTP